MESTSVCDATSTIAQAGGFAPAEAWQQAEKLADLGSDRQRQSNERYTVKARTKTQQQNNSDRDNVLTVRMTMTIDADTAALLKDEAARTGQSFKAVLNQAVKRALGRKAGEVRVETLFSAPFPAEFARQSFNRLAVEWEDEDTVKEPSS